jgi:AcrR family transcriptional regulator
MTTASAQRPRKDQVRNREALVAAAREVFAEYGIDGPLDAIAKRAGLGNATLYRHFPTRLDLIVEILHVNLGRSEAALAEAEACPTGWEGLTMYLEWLFAEQIDNPACRMSTLRAVHAGENSEVDRLRDKTFAELQTLLTRAKQEGACRADRWIEDIFLFLALNEFLFLGLNEPLGHGGHRDPASASRRFLDLCIASLAATPAAVPCGASEPDTVLALRRTLGHELAGLPNQDGNL